MLDNLNLEQKQKRADEKISKVFVKVKIKLIEKMLGTAAVDAKVYETFIAQKMSKAMKDGYITKLEITEDGEPKLHKKSIKDLTEEELKTLVVSKTEETGWTTFHRDENGIFIYDYMIKGFVKNAWSVLQSNGAVPYIFAYKRWINNSVFPGPRKIYLEGKKEEDGFLERSVRFEDPRSGIEKTALSRSDYVNEGTELEFLIEFQYNNGGSKSKPVIPELEDLETCFFGYGKNQGLGQWRGSGGHGSFKVISWDILEEHIRSKKKDEEKGKEKKKKD